MRIVRPLVVALLAFIALGPTLPDFVRVFGHPMYRFGYTMDFGGLVTGVDPNSSAARAGIRPGDKWDYYRTSREIVPTTLIGGVIVPHERLTIGILRDGRQFSANLTADTPGEHIF